MESYGIIIVTYFLTFVGVPRYPLIMFCILHLPKLLEILHYSVFHFSGFIY
jgi:hypothetical protein